MGAKSSIEWTATVNSDGTVTPGSTWNPTRGCSRVSEGCRNCYAETIASRFSNSSDAFFGFAKRTPSGPRWTGKVELVEKALTLPLRWRKPRKIFVNSMSDLFHEALPDEAIDRVFAVMALCPQHTFQCLTKRPKRMLGWVTDRTRTEGIDIRIYKQMRHGRMEPRNPLPKWPLPNVWLGVSVEDQATADERIPLLLRTPAAIRFVSYEPALGPVDFTSIKQQLAPASFQWFSCLSGHDDMGHAEHCWPALDQIIVGGESGLGARPFDIAWARSTVRQCKDAGVACFVKQLGAKPFYETVANDYPLMLHDRKGGDWSEWPEDLRVREFPKARAA